MQRICAPYVGSIDCLAVSGLQPSLTLPNDEEILPQSACTALQQNVRSAILDVARRRLQIIRQSAFTSYTSALRNTAPLQHLGGCSDAQAEKLLCETFEGEFDRCIKRLVAYTREAVKRRSGEGDGGQGKKSNGFGPVSPTLMTWITPHIQVACMEKAEYHLSSMLRPSSKPRSRTRRISQLPNAPSSLRKPGLPTNRYVCSLFHTMHTDIQQVRTWVRLSIHLLIIAPLVPSSTIVSLPILRVHYCPPFPTPTRGQKVSSRGIDPRFRSALACS